MKQLELRAVQLDLARQMESMTFLRDFIDYASSCGFNALFLYLEGRVRTETFPYPAEEDSYTPEQMRDIVACAAEKGMEVIPATQALAHAELFLRYRQMEGLSELHDTNMRGRWDTAARVHETFCPSLEGTRDFLAGYFAELAELFPSKYFHVGLDEAWHLGTCNRCRARPEGQQGIWIEYIQWLHQVVAGRLGKRMMVWDDMFQHYPQALGAIPKDIVLCCWHYDTIGDVPRWHFGDRQRIDKLTAFSEMGFDCLIAPADASWTNPVTFSRYAAERPCLGGLLTMWEKGSSFYEASLPLVGATGRLWNGAAPDDAFRESVQSLFGVSEVAFTALVQAAADRGGFGAGLSGRMASYLAGPLTAKEHGSRVLARALREALESYRPRLAGPRAAGVFEDLLARLEQTELRMELRELVPQFFQPGAQPDAAARERLDGLAAQIENLRDRRLAFWRQVRAGIPEGDYEASFQNLLEGLRGLGTKGDNGLIRLRLFLDQIAQDTEVAVTFAGRDAWEKVFDARLTPADGSAFYERWFEFPSRGVPTALRFETRGYGTQGVCYVEIENAEGRFVPAGLRSVKGRVIDPQHVLVDSVHYALAGEPYTVENFTRHESYANKRRHGFVVSLKKA